MRKEGGRHIDNMDPSLMLLVRLSVSSVAIGCRTLVWRHGMDKVGGTRVVFFLERNTPEWHKSLLFVWCRLVKDSHGNGIGTFPRIATIHDSLMPSDSSLSPCLSGDDVPRPTLTREPFFIHIARTETHPLFLSLCLLTTLLHVMLWNISHNEKPCSLPSLIRDIDPIPTNVHVETDHSLGQPCPCCYQTAV